MSGHSSTVATVTRDIQHAPGGPGTPMPWATSAKSGVGTALSRDSEVWFTIADGVLAELFYPRADEACVRDFGLIVTDGAEFVSQESAACRHDMRSFDHGVPAYHITNTCCNDRYRITKTIVTDPERPAVLQRTTFAPLQTRRNGWRLFVLLTPRLGNRDDANTAWLEDYNGMTALMARHGDACVCLACSTGWASRTVTFIGDQDSWHDLCEHRQLTRFYDRAEDGRVCLAGEIDLQAGQSFVTAVAFGGTPAQAAEHARAALARDFDAVCHQYAAAWVNWHATLEPLDQQTGGRLFRSSGAVLRSHADKRHPGAVVASLSVPWGVGRRGRHVRGYHVVWPRDLCRVGTALLAMNDRDGFYPILEQLRMSQSRDGCWMQSMYVDGQPHSQYVQRDETGLPVLLVDLAVRTGTLSAEGARFYWEMVHNAAAYLVRTGPGTEQDRWETDPGYSPYTMAVEIAALLAAADMADRRQKHLTAAYLRDVADIWHASLDDWTYVTNRELSRRLGIDGYYVRLSPPCKSGSADSTACEMVKLAHRPPGEDTFPVDQIVSPDALALVRFGLRTADDERIANTLRAIDATLKIETPFGPTWRRYSYDGYGEQRDGAPYNGYGVGRGWPLLTGERAHYELAAGHLDDAWRLMRTMEGFSSACGMLPEQVWDSADVPRRRLFRGRPTGSAMPLAWAHAEYITLCRSLRDGKVFDTPPQTVERYLQGGAACVLQNWRFDGKVRSIRRGQRLRLETRAAATVRWSIDDWFTVSDTPMHDTGLGLHFVDLPTEHLSAGRTVRFTFYWPHVGRWEGEDQRVTVREA